jgi:hypothetical protein
MRGQETVGTLLDAGDESLAAFAMQLLSVLIGALAARSRQALSERPARIAAESACWAAVLVVARIPFGIGIGLFRASGSIPPITVLDTYVMPFVVLALFTLRGRRVAGYVGFLWLVFFVREHPLLFTWVWLPPATEMVALPAIGFAVMVLWPQAAPTTLRALWVVPAIAFGVLSLTLAPRWVPGFPILALIPVLASLVLLPIAPALTIGTAIAWAAPSLMTVGNSTQTDVLFAFAPLSMLLVAAVRAAANRVYD